MLEHELALIAKLNDQYMNRRPFAYCDRVTTATRKEINRDDYSGREDFYGDLLQFFDQAKHGGEIISDLQADLRLLYGHQKLRRYLSDRMPENDALASLLDEAESLCLDLLVPEDGGDLPRPAMRTDEENALRICQRDSKANRQRARGQSVDENRRADQ